MVSIHPKMDKQRKLDAINNFYYIKCLIFKWFRIQSALR